MLSREVHTSLRGRGIETTIPRKIYPADPGLIHAFDASGRANTGRALETAVFNELQRRGVDAAYVKTPEGFEVDFLAAYPDGRRELLQICADPSTVDARERELRVMPAYEWMLLEQ